MVRLFSTREATMSKLRRTTIALFVGMSVLGLSKLSSAQYLEGAARATFIVNATKACKKTYGSQTNKIPEPLFEQYCTCAVSGAVDRIPAADLIKDDNGTAELSGENQKIFDEEVTRCAAAVRELTKHSQSQLKSEMPRED
jgi:hypothetical protein